MTINHIYIRVTASRFASTRQFYITALKPLGYREILTINPDSYVGIGSDYPYLFLRALPEGQQSLPTHIAFDAECAALSHWSLSMSLLILSSTIQRG
jgi:hypothetical protein